MNVNEVCNEALIKVPRKIFIKKAEMQGLPSMKSPRKPQLEEWDRKFVEMYEKVSLRNRNRRQNNCSTFDDDILWPTTRGGMVKSAV